jgi:hypothetical protein
MSLHETSFQVHCSMYAKSILIIEILCWTLSIALHIQYTYLKYTMFRKLNLLLSSAGKEESILVGPIRQNQSLSMANDTCLTATGYGLHDSGSTSGRGRRFLSIIQSPDHIRGPPSLLPNGCRGVHYLEVKRPECEADQWQPSTAEVKNNGAIPPLPYTSSWRGA